MENEGVENAVLGKEAEEEACVRGEENELALEAGEQAVLQALRTLGFTGDGEAHEQVEAFKLLLDEKDRARAELEERGLELSAKVAAYEMGVRKEYAGDAAILALAAVETGAELGEAMEKVLERNSAWLPEEASLPQSGANPAGGAAMSLEARLADARARGDNVEAVRIKREAAEGGMLLL